MNRLLRLLGALVAAFLLAFGATLFFVHRGEVPPREVLSLAQAASPEPAGAGSRPDPNYELEKLPVLSRVVMSVKENYVDQRRVDPKAMVFAALDGVEKEVAEVMVEGDPKSGKAVVTVGSAQRTFDASGVKSPWEARAVLADVMGFVKKHLVAHKDLKDIEYAAVNGLLSTLDPHSVLLEPKLYREMRLATKGEFGGLGFVIAMRDGNLTVVRVLKNTPAQRAGVRAKDVIARIDEQSTVNMDLQDAVDRLRGKPTTKVAITVNRTGWTEPRTLQLQREIIAVETVQQSKLLDGGVGYVKLSQFSANSTRDLVQALAALRAQAGGQMKGLVLDLRGNPGGLLEQAIQVSDLFLSQGVIVKTVGEGMRMHEVKEAEPQRDDQLQLPLVVIVNNGSASASEIVAGALKNNGRALVIGRQTFGKGSVQVLYDFTDPARPTDESALKLTIAQYLTPGDVSIQEVGVAPDVLLLPGRALKDQVNFFAPPRMMGEADLDRHFSNPTELSLSDAEKEKRAKERADRTEKAALELRYLLDEKEDKLARQLANDEKREAMQRGHGDAEPEFTPEQQEDEEADANPDEVVEDFQLRFARELLTRAPSHERAKLLEVAKALVGEKREQEAKRLQEKLGALGVDWTAGPAGGTPRATVTVAPPPGRRFTGGDTLPWTVTVENRGDGAFRRLRAWTRVDKNPLLDRREFVFGTLKPGERKSWTVPVKLPKGIDTRHDAVTFVFDEENGNVPPQLAAAVDVVETAKPSFAITAQVDDDGGNGDGLVQRGERIRLHVDVRNVGSGAAGDKTYVSLKNLGDEKIFIEKGRQVLGTIPPGESKTATLELEVKKGGRGETVPLRVMVVDEKLDELVADKIELPFRPHLQPKTAASGAVRVVAAEAPVLAGAAEDAAPIAFARKGAVLPVAARYGDHLYKVEWKKGRHGFVSAAHVAPAKNPGAPQGTVTSVWQREPPRIAIRPDPAKGAPVVDGESLRLEGNAVVPDSAGARSTLRDVFVFVNDQKVFFKVVPEEGGQSKMDFQADLPLKPGNNLVTVFAREDEEFQARRSFVVYRRAPAEVAQGAPAAAPK
jgi:carboxyl-terminal processing protease